MFRYQLAPLAVLLLVGGLTTNPVAAGGKQNPCQPATNQVIVRFTYGSEKAPWIHAVTETFNAEGVKTASGKRICVHAIPKGSGDSVNEIKMGQAGPQEVHATSPASDLYVNLINHEYSEETGKDLLKVEGFLVSSPVVIAVWEPALSKLGPADQIGWSSVFERAKDPSFRYGQTNPERSNSGLSALVAQFYAGAQAAAGKPVPRLSKAKVDDPQVRDFVAKVHESVIHYGQSTGFYAEKMRDGGPSYADAVVIYESDVIQANTSINEKGSDFPRLVAVYPKEGTFATNHPFAIVARDWVDADEEEGAKRYFEYLMSAQTQAQALQYGFRPGVALDLDRNIYDVVWNESKGVRPFDSVHNFLATPSGAVVKEILDAFRDIKKKSLVYLVIDRSGSMDAKIFDMERNRKRSRMEMAVESANLLSGRLQDKDRLALVLYDYQVDYANITPKGQPLSMDAEGKARLAKALEQVQPNGGTAMRDAIASAWDDICTDIKANPSDRSIRILVVLTDGKDNASKKENETQQLIRRIGFNQSDGKGGSLGDPACKIPVFGIAFGDKADDRSLKAITEATGGETRRGDSAEIRKIFERFSDLL
ncbi:MAG: substrate-binding and VWA domain-containing protein [Chromatiaceae bacterium]|nr:substrate-binding and VWA domain-containing protein [Chromatiaceae bacterium]